MCIRDRASGVELRLNDMSDRIELATGKPLNDFQLAAILNPVSYTHLTLPTSDLV